MAYSPKATNGFEFRYNKAGFPANSVLYEGTSGTTYTQGQLVYLTAGSMLAVATTALVSTVGTPVLGVVAATVTCSTKSSERHVPVYDNPLNVYEVTVAGHVDATAAAGAATTITLTGVNATTADTYAGSLVYIYEGPGKGDVRSIASHTAAFPSVITINGEWSATPTTASKAVVLSDFSSAASTNAGINVGQRKRVDSTAKKVAVTRQTGSDGYLNIIGVNPERLSADVMISMVDGILGGAAT